MGKKSRTKLEQRRYSRIDQHKKSGKTLVPPLVQLPRLQSRSWHSDRLPELLWLALIITGVERETALHIFRRVADFIFRLPKEEKFDDITHSGLANLDEDKLGGFLRVLVSDSQSKDLLAPLLLLRNLPAYECWVRVLHPPEHQSEWGSLMAAVASTFDHQSQLATDCRWLRVLAKMVAGKIVLSPETAKEIALYPNHGDMRKVRPSIRAAEIAFATEPSRWPAQFWQQCLADTPCWPLRLRDPGTAITLGYSAESIAITYSSLVNHCHATRVTTDLDARHDTVFGVALYSLAIAGELLRVGNSSSILGRSALRTIVECFVTLAYLLKKDDPELWESYRIFGSGQAKLAFLKLEQVEDTPSYVDTDTLERLANEDVWQEFLPINLGHWEKANLRALSEDAGVKDIYDGFYSWTSSFTHGHWGAIRDTVFDTCGNPLHRLHRIPRQSTQVLPDVVADVGEIVDRILTLVSDAYPGFKQHISTKP